MTVKRITKTKLFVEPANAIRARDAEILKPGREVRVLRRPQTGIYEVVVTRYIRKGRPVRKHARRVRGRTR